MDSSKNTQVQEKEGVGVAEDVEEDLQTNVKVISKSEDLSPRSIRDLNKDRRKSRPTSSKNSQIQTRSNSVKPAESK